MSRYRDCYSCGILIAAGLFGCGSLAAEESGQELTPSEDVFSGPNPHYPYNLAVRAALLGEKRQNRNCQIVAIPSGPREWAVYVVRDEEGKPQVVSKRLHEPLWERMQEVISGGGTKASYSSYAKAQEAALKQLSIDVDTSTASISPELADLLEDVWWRMLGRVHYTDDSKEGYKADGITYYVSHWTTGGEIRSGTTWSPNPGSRPAALVGLAERMAALAEAAPGSTRNTAEATLTTEARALLNRLK